MLQENLEVSVGEMLRGQAKFKKATFMAAQDRSRIRDN